MSYRRLPLVAVVLSLAVLSCSPSSLIPRGLSYPGQFSELVDDLNTWMRSVNRLDADIQNLAVPLAGNPLTAAYILTVIDAGAPTLMSQADWEDFTRPLLTALSSDITSVSEQGFTLQARLEVLRPPDDLRTFHNELITCIKAQVDRARGVEELLRMGSTSRQIDGSACDNWQASLDALQAASPP